MPGPPSVSALRWPSACIMLGRRNPFSGGTLAYAISQAGAETCRLADHEHVHYILDFGRFYVLNFVEAQA